MLRSRYNLLTYSEELNNAIWGKTNATVTANAAVAPDGTTTADNLVEAADVGLVHYTEQSVTKVASSITYTASIFVKRASGTRNLQIRVDAGSLANSVICAFDLGAVTANPVSSAGTFTSVSTSITALSNEWYRCVSVVITGSETTVRARATLLNGTSEGYNGDGTSSLSIWGAQLLTAADQTSTGGAYQRIAAATDYDVSNPVWRPYLAFDGVDDFMSLASAISITTDMTVVRGFGRAAAGISSVGAANSAANTQTDGRWNTGNVRSVSLGNAETDVVGANTATGYFVFSASRNASAQILRQNGTELTSVSPPSVSGSFDNVGRRSATYNSGPIYGLIVLDRELTGSELTATEQWMAGKTGAVLA